MGSISQANVTKCYNPSILPVLSPIVQERRATVSPHLETPQMTVSIADLFAARLRELEEQDRQSQARTLETLVSVRATIAELEALEIPLD